MSCRLLLIALLIAPTAFAGERHHWEGAVDLSYYISDSDLDSWLYRGSGKLRVDEDHDGLRVNRIFLDYTGQITPTLSGRLSLNANNDVADEIELLEAFVQWRPVPAGPLRFRGRLGAFYPRLSLENVDAGWSSPYALSSSVINTWIGEELRTIGAEARLVYDLPWDDRQQIAVEGAIFGYNDPTGAVLTWRGWSAHDRQTGVFGKIPMPEVSVIQAWAPEGDPIPNAEPFKEIDGRPGFYVGAQWRLGKRVLLRAFHYNNHADPEAVSGDDYAWETWFDHLAAQVSLPLDVGLLAQWIDGSSRMGEDLGPWLVQDVDFNAAYVMLTRTFGKHRLSARYEWFDLIPFNDPPGITNQDVGNTYAVAWLYDVNSRVRVGAEYLQIRSTHCETTMCFWVFNGLPRKTNESSVQASLRWRFGSTANPR